MGCAKTTEVNGITSTATESRRRKESFMERYAPGEAKSSNSLLMVPRDPIIGVFSATVVTPVAFGRCATAIFATFHGRSGPHPLDRATGARPAPSDGDQPTTSLPRGDR